MYFKSSMKNVIKFVVTCQKGYQFDIEDDVHYHILNTIFTYGIIQKSDLEKHVHSIYSPCFRNLVRSSIQELYDSNIFSCCVIVTYTYEK